MKTLLVLVILALLTACSSQKLDEKKWKKSVSEQKKEDIYKENHSEGRYHNPWMEGTKSFKTFLRWKVTKAETYPIGMKDYLPKRLVTDIKELKERKRYVLWIGHMTFLIRVDENFYLLDPIFSSRALLPERYVDLPIELEDILDITKAGRLRVLITHNHYDHLDKKTIKKLPEGTEIYLPAGNKSLVDGWGSYEITEMQWEEVAEEITFVPASHWSNRATQGRNTTLWGSFIVEDGEKTIFLGGDSGYFIGFKELGDNYDIDIALVSLGAYEPRWFMHESHLNVPESVRAMEDMKAEIMIPGHWGTFKLGDEPPGYPKYQFNKIEDARVKIMDIGEVIFF